MHGAMQGDEGGAEGVMRRGGRGEHSLCMNTNSNVGGQLAKWDSCMRIGNSAHVTGQSGYGYSMHRIWILVALSPKYHGTRPQIQIRTCSRRSSNSLR